MSLDKIQIWIVISTSKTMLLKCLVWTTQWSKKFKERVSWSIALDVAVKRFYTISGITSTFSCVFEISEPSTTNFLSLAVWTVFIVSAKKLCCAMRVDMPFFKSLLSPHSLKIERALHAASFKGFQRIRPVAPDAAINAGKRRRCREGSVCFLSLFGFVGSGAKDSATRRSSRWSSPMAFYSFERRFTRYSIDSAKLANFAKISLVLTTQNMGVE